jgi:hypothetical protein
MHGVVVMVKTIGPAQLLAYVNPLCSTGHSALTCSAVRNCPPKYAETLAPKGEHFLCPWSVARNSPAVPSNWIADEIREVIFITASFARTASEKGRLPMSLEENKSNTRCWFEELNQGNLAVKRR